MEALSFWIPEIFLGATLLLMSTTAWLRDKNTPKTFYTIAKFGVWAALAAEIIWYYQSGEAEDSQIMLFKVIVYLLLLGNMYISLKWFLGDDRPSFRFYFLIVLMQLLLIAAVSAEDLLVFMLFLQGGVLLTYLLMRTELDPDEAYPEIRRFGVIALIYAGIGLAGVWGLFSLSGSFDFGAVSAYLKVHQQEAAVFAACAMILVSLLFVLGVAPFHFWMSGAFSEAILPVSGYLSIVPLFAYYACLLNLVSGVMMPVYPLLRPAIEVFAVLSVVIGAVGANGENNVRRLFVYSRIFVIGVVLSVLLTFSSAAGFSGFVYLLVSMLALTGIYTVFYAFKSKGDYLSDLNDIAGLAESKPYLAAAVLLFMTSLLGFPPLIGFLGMVIVVNHLVDLHSYGLLLTVIFGILMMASAYLRVIKVMYFDSKHRGFDRVDRGIYVILLADVVIIVALLLSPRELLGAVEQMLR